MGESKDSYFFENRETSDSLYGRKTKEGGSREARALVNLEMEKAAINALSSEFNDVNFIQSQAIQLLTSLKETETEQNLFGQGSATSTISRLLLKGLLILVSNMNNKKVFRVNKERLSEFIK